MTNERRDNELGSALRELPVPEHRPGFFEALTAQISGDEVDAVVHPFEPEGITEMTVLIPNSTEPPRTTRRSGRLARAVAAAAAIFVTIGTVAVLWPGGNEFISDAPTTAESSVPRETIQPTTATDLSSFVFAADQVPPFTATVVYDMNPLNSTEWIPAGATLTARVLFSDPENYLYEVLSADPATEAMDVFGVPGLTILGAGDRAWIKEPGDSPAYPGENFGPARHLLWDSTYPAWDEICSTGQFEAIGIETIAGRTTTHGRCSTLPDDYELWVDTGTGIIMKLRGALGQGDLVPATTRDGGFEIVEIELGAVELPAAPMLSGAANPSDLPPLHAVRVEEYSNENGPSWTFTQEIWFQDNETWRFETTDSTSEELTVGSFTLRTGDLLRGCDASGPSCWEQPNPEDVYFPVTTVPVDTLRQYCDLVATETVSGRAAEHYVCDIAFDEYDPGHWVPGATLETPEHRWVDVSTSIGLKYEGPFGQWSLTAFEVNPLFESGTFDYEPLTGTGPDGEECVADDPICQFWSSTLLVKGEPAPTFSGPLLDGSIFHLEDLRGQPAVVFRWGEGFAPGVLEQFMDDFQALSEKWGDQVGFLGAPEMADPAQIARIMERGGYTFDNVACFEVDGHDQPLVCQPADVGQVWQVGWAAWIVLDEYGNVFDAFQGQLGAFEHIDSVIQAVVNP